MRLASITLGLLATVGLGACGKSNQATGVEDIKKVFAKEGWKTDALVVQDPSRFSAQKCLAGPMEGLDVVICEYGSIEAVGQGKAGTEAWVGQAVTGVALENGRTVLGIADRGRADPNGKLVHKISAAYRALKP
jgi:hypothetical protein